MGCCLRKLWEDYSSQAFVLREAIGDLKLVKLFGNSKLQGSTKILGDYKFEAFILHHAIK